MPSLVLFTAFSNSELFCQTRDKKMRVLNVTKFPKGPNDKDKDTIVLVERIISVRRLTEGAQITFDDKTTLQVTEDLETLTHLIEAANPKGSDGA